MTDLFLRVRRRLQVPGFWPSNPQTLKPSDPQTLGPSDPQTLKHMALRALVELLASELLAEVGGSLVAGKEQLPFQISASTVAGPPDFRTDRSFATG